ncbi:MAG: hypothetical protein WCT04_19605 [Planctomycetota bacterium]
MATNPSNSDTPGGSGGSGAPNPTAKPRATIVMKKSDAKPSGSAPAQPDAASAPKPAAVPGNSQRLAPARPNTPGLSARRPAIQIQADREALGLSAARPSDMIAGLDEVAKRAEALAAREAAKRKSGGKLSLNEALHVDDTGRKWTRWVQLGIAAAILAACVAGGLMLYGANHKPTDNRVALASTNALMRDLEIAAQKMDRFAEGESITPQSVKSKISKYVKEQLEALEKTLDRDRAAGRQPDKGLISKREEYKKLLTFNDGWGNPFELTITSNELGIRSTSKEKDVPAEPVKVPLGAASKSKTEDKEK